MKILTIAHNAVAESNRQRIEALRRIPGVEVTLLTPPWWYEEGRNIAAQPQANPRSSHAALPSDTSPPSATSAPSAAWRWTDPLPAGDALRASDAWPPSDPVADGDAWQPSDVSRSMDPVPDGDERSPSTTSHTNDDSRASDAAWPARKPWRVGRTIFTGNGTRHLYLRGLFEAVRECTPDVIDLFEEPFSLVALQTLLARNLLAPNAALVVYSAVNVDRAWRWPYRAIERMVLRAADGAHAPNSDVPPILLRRGLRGPAAVIPLGVDPSRFEVATPLPLPDIPRPRIGFLGRFEPVKGLDVLLQAFAQLRSRSSASAQSTAASPSPERAATFAQPATAVTPPARAATSTQSTAAASAPVPAAATGSSPALATSASESAAPGSSPEPTIPGQSATAVARMTSAGSSAASSLPAVSATASDRDGLFSTVSLVLAGDGSLRGQLGGSGVHVLPPMSYEQVPAFLRALDVLVLPSVTILPLHREQFGRVLVEVMAAGVPVIGSTSGAIPEVIGDAGLVVPERDPTALAEAIERILTDSALRARLIDLGRRRVASHYAWSAVAEQSVALFRSAMLHRRRAAAHLEEVRA